MGEITTTDANAEYKLPPIAWIAFAGLALCAYFIGLDLPFLGPDEPRYAQVAVEMFNRGDWVTPTLGGHNWFEKPVLLYWYEILSFNIFGVSEFAARLGSAFSGLATVAALWILGRNIDTVKKRLGKWFALLGATTLSIIGFSHGASFDIIVTFPLTAALVSFYIFEKRNSSGESGQATPLLLFYVFVGVAVLAKGLIGVVFPFAIITFYYFLSRKLPSAKFLLSVVWGMAVASIIAALWYLPMYLTHGYEFIDEFIIQHHFQRFTSNKYQHPQPFYFFWWILPLMTLPWMPLFFAELWQRSRAFFSSGAEISPTTAKSSIFLFALAWLLVPLVFFSLSGSKLPGYVLPSVPPAIVIAAIFVVRSVKRSRTWAVSIYLLGCVVLVGTIALSIFYLPSFALTDSVKGLIASANARGYTNDPLIGIYHVSHSAEYYASNRLVRDGDGRQPRIYTAQEVVKAMERASTARMLVIIPLDRLKQITESPLVNFEILSDNTELAILAVTKKP